MTVDTTTPAPAATREEPQTPGPGAPAPRRNTQRSGHSVSLHGAVVGLLLILSIASWWHVWGGMHAATRITCQCGDVSEALNFLAWTPWAIAHGHNPFLSNALFAGQGGVNMLDNATWMFWGVLFAPVTWLFGPVVTFNVVVTLAPVISGWAFFLMVRKFTRFVPAQVVGALFFGFSPLVITTEPIGHFFQFWLFFPPLVLLLLYDLYAEERRNPVALGLALGALVIVQFFTSTETLAICLVLAAAASVVALVLAPQAARMRGRRITTGLGVGAVTAGVVLAYPTWYALAGPRHVTGAIWPGMGLASTFVSGLFRAHTTVLLPSIFPGVFVGPPAPNITYIGIAIAAFIAVSAPLWIRRRVGVVAFVTGAASWLLALGTRPLGGSFPSWLLPWRVVVHIPILSNVVPQRFAIGTVTAAAVLLAVSADCWWLRLNAWVSGRGGHVRHRQLQGAVAVAVAMVAAATTLPVATAYAVPFAVKNVRTPAWFRDVATHVAPGTVILTYPFPFGSTQQPEGWQAIDGMRFRLAGGYDVVPGSDGRHSEWVRPLGGATALLAHMSNPIYPFPALTTANERVIRSAVERWGVQDVVVTDQGRAPRLAVAYFTATLGRIPQYQEHAWVWYGLAGPSLLQVDPATFHRCSTGPGLGGPLATARCIVHNGR